MTNTLILSLGLLIKHVHLCLVMMVSVHLLEKNGQSLFSLMGDTCPTCHGLGLVLSKESIFINVCDDIEAMNIDMHHGKARIKLNPDVYEYFSERKSRLKELFKMDFEVQQDANVDREDYQIIFE